MSSHNGKSGRQDGDGKHPAKEEGEPLAKKLRSEQSPAASVEENQASEQRSASDMDEPLDASYSLLDAATDGNVRAIKIRLAEGADLEEEDMDGRTSLALAILNKRMRAVELLVAEGADIYAHWEDEYDALHLACEVGLVRAIPLLVSKGASVHDTGNEFGETPLHRAAACGEVAAMRTLVEMGAKIDALDGAQRTPFHSAAVWGELAAMEFLESKGCDIGAKDVDGWSAMCCAVEENTYETATKVIQWLARKGIDVDLKTTDGSTALHLAALHSNKAAAAALIREGANIEATDQETFTPFHCAALNGSTQVMELLRLNGANIFAKAHNSFTAIQLVAFKNFDFNVASVINYLATHGADINQHVEDKYRHHTEKTPLWLASRFQNHEAIAALSALGANHDNAKMGALAEAARSGALTSMEMLLAGGAEPNIEGKMVPLHQAAYDSGRPALDLLFAHGAVVGVRGTNGETEMHWAAANATPATLAFLMSKGSTVSEVDNDGRTPLHFAARGGCAANIRFLINNGADIEAVSTDGWRPLHDAADKGQIHTINDLVQLGAVVDARSTAGTPLHIATNNSVCSVVAALLAHGASTAMVNGSGYTPLHLASTQHDLDFNIDILMNVDRGCIPTPLSEAYENHNYKNGIVRLVDTLIDHGRADTETVCLDVHRRSALHLAIVHNSPAAVALVAKGASLTTVDADMNTALHLAMYKPNPELVQFLVDKDANVHAKNKEGYTPLHLCGSALPVLQDVSARVIQILVSKGANVMTKNRSGVTPLHLAAANDNTYAIRILLYFGADIHALSVGGRTPLHWAAEMGRAAAIELLIRNGASLESANGGPTALEQFNKANLRLSTEHKAKILRLLGDKYYEHNAQWRTYEAPTFNDN